MLNLSKESAIAPFFDVSLSRIATRGVGTLKVRDLQIRRKQRAFSITPKVSGIDYLSLDASGTLQQRRHAVRPVGSATYALSAATKAGDIPA